MNFWLVLLLVWIVATLVRLVPVQDHRGFSKITISECISRFYHFGKIGGLNLPPQYSILETLVYEWRHGEFSTHMFFQQCHQQVGSIFEIAGLFRRFCFVFVSEPSLVEQILSDKHNFPTRGATGFSTYVPNGLLALPTGPMWSLHRRLISKYLSTAYLKSYVPTIEEELKILISKWKKPNGEKPINIHFDLSCFALDVIGRIAFGKNFNAQTTQNNKYYQAFQVLLRETVNRTGEPMIFWYLNFPRWIRFLRAYYWMRSEVAKTIQVNREMIAKNQPQDNLITHLLSEDRDTQLSEIELLEETGTLIGAGHETTGNTVCFTFYLLALHPEKQEKLRAEVDTFFKTHKDSISYDDLKELNYCVAVFYETLRLYPTVPLFPRLLTTEAMKIGGYDIQKGSLVFVNQMFMNFQIYDPHSFRPERFGEQPPELSQTKPVGIPEEKGTSDYLFCPFGASLRTCIGQRLAMLEGIMIIANIIRNFEIKLPKNSPIIKTQSAITLTPHEGKLNMILIPRE